MSFFFFSSRRRHTRWPRDWSSDVCSSDLAAVERYGAGTGSSRLIAGHADLHADVEAKLAAFKRTEAAIIFPSGYQANVGTITTLVGRGDHVFSDELNHASIIDGCRLSRATTHVYPHCKMQSLAAALAEAPREGRRL